MYHFVLCCLESVLCVCVRVHARTENCVVCSNWRLKGKCKCSVFKHIHVTSLGECWLVLIPCHIKVIHWKWTLNSKEIIDGAQFQIWKMYKVGGSLPYLVESLDSAQKMSNLRENSPPPPPSISLSCFLHRKNHRMPPLSVLVISDQLVLPGLKRSFFTLFCSPVHIPF